MSWESEFNNQWQSFLGNVEILIRKEISKNGHLDATLVNKIIKSETEKWSISTHYNGAWLKNLERQYPDIGKQFINALEGFNLSQKISLRYSLPILPFLVSLVIMIMIFFGLEQLHLLSESLPRIGEWLKMLNSFRKLSFTTIIGLTVFLLLNTLREKAREIKVKKLIEDIKLNLEKAGKNLGYIASMADKRSHGTK